LSHFAEIDENNIVLRVIVGDNDDPNGDEGYQFIVETLGGRWIQTSYNSNFRGNYAGIGYSYIEEHDIFMPPKFFNSWVLNVEDASWDPPKEYPSEIGDGKYFWDEESLDWVAN